MTFFPYTNTNRPIIRKNQIDRIETILSTSDSKRLRNGHERSISETRRCQIDSKKALKDGLEFQIIAGSEKRIGFDILNIQHLCKQVQCLINSDLVFLC